MYRPGVVFGTPACVCLLLLAQGRGAPADAPRVDLPWAKPRCGIEALGADHLPVGWAELGLSKRTVSAGWKRVSFSKTGLPESISVRETHLLASPVALEFSAGGGATTLAVVSQSFVKEGKARVTGTTLLSSGVVDVEVGVRVEYDFMIRVDLQVRPKEGRLPLERLVLSCALPRELSEFCHYMDEEPAEFKGGGIYAERRRKFVRVEAEETVARGFCPVFWLGNTHAGLSWNTESARNWNTAPEQAIVFSRRDGMLRFNLVTKPLTVDHALSYTLLVQPTPVRDMPKDWRTWNIGCRQLTTGKVPSEDTISDFVMYWSSIHRLGPVAYNSWVRNPQPLREVVRRDHGKGFQVLPYIVPILVSFEEFFSKDGKDYHFVDPARKARVDDWCVKIHGGDDARLGHHKRKQAPEGAVVITDIEERNRLWQGEYAPDATYNNAFVGPVSGYSDFLAWHVRELVRDYDADGLYVDGVTPRADFRIVDGDPNRAFRDFDGNVRAVYPYLAMRDLTKRMRHVVDKGTARKGCLLGHTSGTRVMSVLSHYDIALIGENFFYWYQEPEKRDASPSGDYYYAHIFGDIDDLKPKLFWRPWGMPTFLLPELRGRDRQMVKEPTKGTRTMLAYVLHFDMLIWPNWSDTKQIYEWRRMKREFGMADTAAGTVEFVPYWENELITSDDDAAKISYYTRVAIPDPYIDKDPAPDLLLIVSNLRFDAADVGVRLPAELRGCRITDAGSKTQLAPPAQGMVTLTLEPYDFAVLRIRAREE